MTNYVDPNDVVQPSQYVNPSEVLGTPEHLGSTHGESFSSRRERQASTFGDIPRGFMSGLSDIGTGALQRIMELSGNPRAPMLQQMVARERAAQAKADEEKGPPSITYDIARMAGQSAPAVPLMAAIPPTVSMIPSALGSAGLGTLYSSLYPSASNKETMVNMAIGGLGAAGGDLASRALLPVSARNLTQSQKDIIDIAKREGIPLRTSEATGSAAIKNFEQMAANRPGTAGMEQRFNERQTKAINQAISSRFGPPLSEIGPVERKTAQDTIGTELRSLVQGKSVRLDTDLVAAAANMDAKYAAGGRLTMSPEMQRVIDAAISESYRGQVNGETAQSIRSILLGKMRDAAKSDNTELADVYRNLADGLNKAIKGSMNADEATKWAAANRRYMNYKIYEDSLIPSPTEALGDVPFNRLAAAMERNRPNSYLQGKNEDLADLARLGQVVKPPGRSALLGSQGMPIVRQAEDAARIPVQALLQQQFIQNYLTGSLPGQKFIRDSPVSSALLDAILRSEGLSLAPKINEKSSDRARKGP